MAELEKIPSSNIILNDEQRQFMLNNKKKAEEKLKLKLQKKENKNIENTETKNINKKSNEKEQQTNNENNQSILSNTRKRKIVYCDYNLSEIVDSKGGFLTEDNDNEKKLKQDSKTVQIKHNLPICLELDKNPKCRECKSLDIDQNYLEYFNVLVCRNCKNSIPEKYSLLTKTECKEDYLLTDSELRDRELLPCWEKPNPHKSTWNNMMLFVRYQVEEYAFKKWGSEKGLDDEFDRRETEKRERKEKKFNSKLKELRRKTRTSIWLKEKKENHIHEFGETINNEETGESTRRCNICGYLEVFEEF